MNRYQKDRKKIVFGNGATIVQVGRKLKTRLGIELEQLTLREAKKITTAPCPAYANWKPSGKRLSGLHAVPARNALRLRLCNLEWRTSGGLKGATRNLPVAPKW